MPPTQSYTKQWLKFAVPNEISDDGEILYSNVTQTDWLKFSKGLGAVESPPLALRFLRYDAASGHILIVELPTARHETIRDWCTMEFAEHGHRPYLHALGSVTAELERPFLQSFWKLVIQRILRP